MSTSSKPVPCTVYLNPDKEKELIINENKGRTGIYRWVHLESGKSYIGSSVKLNIRFRQYFNYNHISYPGRNLIIYKALLKYGYSAFRLEILEYCSPSSEVLEPRVQYYRNSFKPEYNISDLRKLNVLGKKTQRRYFHTGAYLRTIIPSMNYIDALSQKKAILQDNEGKSGVYR
jgi:hypothetical protein